MSPVVTSLQRSTISSGIGHRPGQANAIGIERGESKDAYGCVTHRLARSCSALLRSYWVIGLSFEPLGSVAVSCDTVRLLLLRITGIGMLRELSALESASS